MATRKDTYGFDEDSDRTEVTRPLGYDYGTYYGGYYAEEEKTPERDVDELVQFRGGTAQPSGQKSWVQRGPAPEIPELREFEAPEEWTGTEKAGAVQKEAALGLRETRRALREAISGLSDDPASKLAIAKALQSHGMNIERTISGARRSAKAEEAAEYNRKLGVAQIKYQSYLQDRSQRIQQAWNQWLSSGVQYSQNIYNFDDELTKGYSQSYYQSQSSRTG